MPVVRPSPLVCSARHSQRCGPGHSESGPLGVRSSSPGRGVPAGGARAPLAGDGAGPPRPQAAASPRSPPPPGSRPRPPSAGQEPPCWLGCRLPGSSGRGVAGRAFPVGATCLCPAPGTTPPARAPARLDRVASDVWQTEGTGCFLVRTDRQLFAGARGRDRNAPPPSRLRAEKSGLGSHSGGGVGSPTFPSPRGVTPRAGGQRPPPLPASGQGAVRDAGPDR